MKWASGLISTGSGSAAGATWGHNRFGQYVRRRAIPVNPNSPRQATIRAFLQAAVVAWQEQLGDSERNSWEVYAAAINWPTSLGTVKLTGEMMWIRTYVALREAGLTNLAIVVANGTAPAVLDLSTFTPVTFTLASPNTASVAFTNTDGWATEDGGFLLLYAGMPQSPARNFFGGPWQFLGKVTGDTATPPTSPAALTWPFTAGAGQRVWLYGRAIRVDGRLTSKIPTGPVLAT